MNTSLSSIAPSLFQFNKQIIELFIDFIKFQFFTKGKREDPEATTIIKDIHTDLDHYQKEKKNQDVEMNESTSNHDLYQLYQRDLGNRECIKRVKVYLSILTNWSSMNNVFMKNKVLDLILLLLNRPDTQIQKSCLNVLSNFSTIPLMNYKELLEKLCDDNTYRDAMLALHLEESEGFIKREDRYIIVPIILRILYGRLLFRKMKSKVPLSVKRSAILNYISCLSYAEFKPFLFMILCPFTKNLDVPPVQTEEDVQKLMNIIDIKHTSASRKLGFLNMAYDVIRYMKDRTESFIHYFLAIIACLLKETLGEANSEEIQKTIEEETNEPNQIEEENNDENDEEEEEEEVKKDGRYYHQKNIQRQIRGLCIKRLMECIGNFSSYDYNPWRLVLFKPLTPLYKALPSSILGMNKPPALLHMTYLISFSPSLYYLYDVQPLLLSSMIECISVGVENDRPIGTNIMKEILGTLDNLLGLTDVQEESNELNYVSELQNRELAEMKNKMITEMVIEDQEEINENIEKKQSKKALKYNQDSDDEDDELELLKEQIQTQKSRKDKQKGMTY